MALDVLNDAVDSLLEGIGSLLISMRRHPWFFSATFFFGAVFCAALIALPDFRHNTASIFQQNPVLILALASALAAGTVPLLLRYLGRSPDGYFAGRAGGVDGPRPSMSPGLPRRAALEAEIAEVHSDLEAIQSKSYGVTAETSLAVAERKLSTTLVIEIQHTFYSSQERLVQEIGALGRRGNLNLVIGVVTTVLAAALLAYLILTAPTFHDLTGVLSHYIPRISTVVFIEVFSFFFLRLYKSTLAEIKYYQNELTTLAMYKIAFDGAVSSAELTIMTRVLESFSKVNRNELTNSVEAGNVDYKAVSEVLEKFAKLAVEASRGK